MSGCSTDCGADKVTVPAVPQKTASLFAVQAMLDEPLDHLLADVSQLPFRRVPRLCVKLLLPPLASLSQ